MILNFLFFISNFQLATRLLLNVDHGNTQEIGFETCAFEERINWI